ncbi:hypothetical protein WIW50_00730 [Flavobacteriaceae bacterium 3-367]
MKWHKSYTRTKLFFTSAYIHLMSHLRIYARKYRRAYYGMFTL